ncbi:MAG: hypothetical protein HY322_17170 [Betaproteobacteria bacterium]|nr:hypothetical protein [Betaproteobacteria bacterium]
MKSTALSELLPQWTKFVVTDLSGRDPLGLARVAASITDYLMPGIVVATDRARYYALYSWILWNIRATETPTTDSAFAEAFQRRESAFAIATLLQDPDASPVGKRAVARELERADTDIRTGFRILPSNDLGGFGQYYSGSLYNLGLTHHPAEEFDQVTADRGTRLAEAIEKTIWSTQWSTKRAFRKRRISLKTLQASAVRLSLDAIHKSFAQHERVVLTDIFFGFDARESGVTSLRRQSLARLLDLVRAYARYSIPLGATDGATLDDQLLLGPAYFGTLVDADGDAAASYVPPQFLISCSNLWRQFCLHEIVSWTLDSILSAVLSLLGEAPGRGLPIDKVVESLTGKELVRAIEAHTNLKVPTTEALLARVGVQEIPPVESCQKARLRFSLKAKLNEDILMRSAATKPVELVARALPCLALLYAKWRDGSDDPAWIAIRAMAGPELAATTVLPRLDSWLVTNQAWSTAIRILVELVVAQHDRIMYEKGRLEACWVHRDGDRLVFDQDYPAGYPAHNSRQRAAMGILVDLGLVQGNKDGRYAPTKDGDRVFVRAKELGR